MERNSACALTILSITPHAMRPAMSTLRNCGRFTAFAPSRGGASRFAGLDLLGSRTGGIERGYCQPLHRGVPPVPHDPSGHIDDRTSLRRCVGRRRTQDRNTDRRQTGIRTPKQLLNLLEDTIDERVTRLLYHGPRPTGLHDGGVRHRLSERRFYIDRADFHE